MLNDKMPESWGLHWFRRDLRLLGNRAFQINYQKSAGKVLGIFCFDKNFLSREDFSHNRFALFLDSLLALRQDLQRCGGDLLVIDDLPHVAFDKLVEYFKNNQIPSPSLITWNRDYEPFARNRDQNIQNLLSKLNIPIATDRDHLIFEPHEMLKDDGTYYQVYTPFANRWFKKFYQEGGTSRIQSREKIIRYLENSEREYPDRLSLTWQILVQNRNFPYKDNLEEFIKCNNQQVSISIPPGGWKHGLIQTLAFEDHINQYKEMRDFPAEKGTSRLSMYLKNGSITTAQIISILSLDRQEPLPNTGKSQFLKELVWREFYYSILFNRPDCEVTAFNKKYADIKWENNLEYFEKWKKGQTGHPIVDAGMRELLTTGWMHNRVRMIVASFLTKDLLIDWRWGENHFMKYLLDGDLAPNNGGWQWAASTGCDAQPYFRIFNPWLQGEKFDKNGDYIRKFVPELREAPTKLLHSPDAQRGAFGYPDPIVSHSEQRFKALSLFSLSEVTHKRK